MRSYRQYCGLARGLDVVGDRWTLLIVRELLTLGPSRYTDLRNGLPGIATNMLGDRLREMEKAGIVERVEAPPPVATTLFRLTPRGEALAPVIRAVGIWAGPTLGQWKAGEKFRSHWLIIPLELHLVDREPQGPPLSVELRTGDDPLVIEARGGSVRVRRGAATAPDMVLDGRPDLALGVLLGRTALTTAMRHGLRVKGDTRALERLQPLPPSA